MRSCIRQTLTLALGALALGILVFLLLFFGVLVLIPAAVGGIVFFTLVAALAGSGLLALTLGILRAERSPALADAWLCCGETAAVSALGAVLTALVTALTTSVEVGLFLGVSACVFFLTLFFGALVCFLRRYVTARFANCGC